MTERATNWDHVSYLLASKYRTAVLTAIAGTPRTPAEIEAETGIEITHVSRALSELREKEFVELLVPEDRHKGRIYGATDKGEQANDIVVNRAGRTDE